MKRFFAFCMVPAMAMAFVGCEKEDRGQEDNDHDHFDAWRLDDGDGNHDGRYLRKSARSAEAVTDASKHDEALLNSAGFWRRRWFRHHPPSSQLWSIATCYDDLVTTFWIARESKRGPKPERES